MTQPLVHEPFEGFTQSDFDVDIAVVGGGVGGAYTAWRLKQQYPKKKIALFEYSNRIGGRLYTVTLPGMPHVHAEVGGMRYIPDSQAFVTNLIGQLNLTPRDFPMGGKDDPGGQNNLMYLRRRLLRAFELQDPSLVPYLMNEVERGMNPDQLQKWVMDLLVPNAAEINQLPAKEAQDAWNQVKVFNGEPLYKLGFWNLLYKVLSSEAYQFMDDAGGYYTNVANTTSVLSLPVFEFGPKIKYKTLVEGYDSIPIAMAKLFDPDAFGRKGKAGRAQQLLFNHRLDSMTRMDRGKKKAYALLFARTHTDAAGRTRDVWSGGHRETVRVFADQVVLAMPRRSLELVRWGPFAFDPDVRGLVESVISQSAFKLFLAYPQPWWRPLNLEAGRSITDMPLRQAFYFQTEQDMPGGEKGNLNSLMMASYNDLGSVPFWKALEEGDPFRGRPNPWVPAGKEVKPHRFEVTEQMVQAAQQQVQEMHGLKFVPEPYSAVYHDWSDDPYGAGWHAWKAGLEFWKLMPKIRRPVADEDVFVCGEAYSINQGWVEGALQTAELMLDENFGMKPPKWLPDGYWLGY